MFEQALERWLSDRRRGALEAEIERYYSFLGLGERAEDASWAGLSARSLGESWE